MSDLSDRIAKELLDRYRILWTDPDTEMEVEEEAVSLSVTLEHILGPEPWRTVLGFQPGENPSLQMVKTKAFNLRMAAVGDQQATERVDAAFDAALKEINNEFGSVP